MKYNKSILILIFTIFLFTISAVNAVDVNETLLSSKNADYTVLSLDNEITDDNLEISEKNATLTQMNNGEILGANQSTYSELAREIGSGGNIELKHKYYTYDSGSTINIRVGNSVIDGKGAVIDMAGSKNMRAFTTFNVIIKNLTIKNANFDGEGGAICFFGASTMANCNFINNSGRFGGAVYFDNAGDVTNCTFTDNHVSQFGGAIYFTKNGAANIKNCNFTGNIAAARGGAVSINQGILINCNFTNNSAKETGGGAVYFWDGGDVINCTFTDNSANQMGGAINLFRSKLTNCNFTGNTAFEGGAVYIRSQSIVENCNFASNNASWGSAIYFYEVYSSDTLTVSNSIFLKNRANALALDVVKNDNNIIITFKGQNNLLNAIHNRGYEKIIFNNVTYWGKNGITTITNNISKSDNEEGQNITVGVVVNDKIVLNEVKVTDEKGTIVLNMTAGDNYYITARHVTDSYYTGAEKTISKMAFSVNVTSQTIHNRTVNITAKSNIYSEVMPAKLLFILPNGKNITANYADNGTWWAEHTFDAYGEYNVGASYAGLNNGTVNNGTITITKADSTITLDDIVLNYGESKNVTVKTQGATGISAEIDKNPVDVKNFTIQISGFAAGNYTLTVTTIADDDHNSVNKTVQITVNKADPKMKVTAEGNEIDVELPSDATGNVSTIINGKEEFYPIVNGIAIIPLYHLKPGNYSFDVKYSGDKNYSKDSAKIKTEISKITPEMTVKANEKEISVELPDDATGSVKTTVNGKEITATISKGKAAIPLDGLNPGNYTFDVQYLGNDKYYSRTEKTSLYIPKIDPNMDASFEVNEIVIELPNDATGNVSTVINGVDYVSPVVDGLAIIPLYDVKPGNYTLDIKYSGDDKYLEDNAKVDAELYKVTPEMTVSVKDNVINVVLPDDVTGNVTVNVGGKEFTSAVKNGKVKITVTGLDPGKYTANVKYSGNDYYYPRSEKTSITIPKIDAKMNATFEVNEIVVELPEDATGEVSTVINGVDYVSPVVDGLAIIPLYDVKPGNYTLDIKYSGDDKYLEDNAKVDAELYKVTPEMTVSVKDNVINVVLPDDVTGNVTVNVGGKEFTAAVKNGKVKITVTGLDPGKYDAQVKYSGDDYYYPRTEKTSITIPKIDAKMNATFEVNEIVVELPEDATGEVSTVINGVDYVSPVVDGLAIIPLYDVKPGNYTLDIKYSGDDKYLEDNAKVDAELYKVTPEMTVSVKDNVINVVLPDDVTGNVTVNVGGKEFTAAVKNGKATITLSGLEPGKYAANVKYSGNDYYYPRTEKTDVTIPKINPEMKVHKNNDNIIVELPHDATGNVILEVASEKLTAPVEKGKAEFSLDKLPSGEHDAKITYSGDDKYNSAIASEKIIIDGIELVADDVVKYFSGSERLIITLLNNDKPVKSKEINITLNGVTYSRVTDEKGQASLGINLVSGNYTALVETEEYSISTLVDIEIKSTVYSNDLVKMFRNATQYYALFLDGKGNPLANTDIIFNIHGVFYTRTTNASGWAKLNINLEEGEYIITALNTVTGESKGYTITVLSLLESSDLTKYYKNDSQYVVRVHSDDGGWAKSGTELLFNINGVFYTRTTNETGHVKLNINLEPGEYIITADCKGCYKSNNITVLPVLTAEDLTKKYGTKDQFTASLVDGQGKAYAGQSIQFNINGVFYNRTTDSNGQAKLNINLQPGEYIITSSYNGASIGNKVTVTA